MTTTLTNATAQQNSFSVYLTPQTTQGEIDSNPVFDNVHLRTGGLPAITPTFEQSSAITVDYQPRDSIKTGEDLGFEGEAEFNQQSKVLLAAAIHSAITDNSAGALATISTTATDIVDSGVAAFTNIEVGDFIFASGFGDINNDGAYLVTAKADNGTVTVNPSPASVEPEGATVTISSNKAELGNTTCLYTVQTRVRDDSQVGSVAYETMYDGFTNTYSMTIPEQGIITNSIAMVFESLLPGLAEISGQTDNPLQTGQVATTPLIRVWEDGVLNDECFLKTFDLSIDNAYAANSVAQCSKKRQARATPNVSGTINTVTFLENTYEWRARMRTETPVNMALEINLKDGYKMVVVIPKMKFTGHTFEGDTAVSNALPYVAEKDPVTGVALQVFTNY